MSTAVRGGNEISKSSFSMDNTYRDTAIKRTVRNAKGKAMTGRLLAGRGISWGGYKAPMAWQLSLRKRDRMRTRQIYDKIFDRTGKGGTHQSTGTVGGNRVGPGLCKAAGYRRGSDWVVRSPSDTTIRGVRQNACLAIQRPAQEHGPDLSGRELWKVVQEQ